MSLLRKRVIVRANGTPRTLFLIEEVRKGDVYIKLKSGTQVGLPPNAIPITQERYSIHMSNRSTAYNTLKSRIDLANGYEGTCVALTDSIKSKRGFSHIFSYRVSDLISDFFNVKNVGGDVFDIGNYDTAQYVLVIGFFVGHPSTKFEVDSSDVIIKSFISNNFQIVICYHWWNVPSLPFSWKMHSLTIPTELFDGDNVRESLYEMLEGKDPDHCVEIFISLSRELKVNLLENYQSLTDDMIMKSIIQ